MRNSEQTRDCVTNGGSEIHVDTVIPVLLRMSTSQKTGQNFHNCTLQIDEKN